MLSANGAALPGPHPFYSDLSMSMQKYDFAAFISYKSDDEKWARWLQNELESYRLPSVLCKRNPGLKRRLGKCFRYHTDIQPGKLTEELQSKLERSGYLLVICSPRSAGSTWVGQEISIFKALGRTDRIIPVIVEGSPYSGDKDAECLHPVIKELFPRTDDPATDKEILGVNLNEEGPGSSRVKRRRAVIQIASRMTCVSFDSLWNRERVRIRRQTAAWTAGSFAMLAALFLAWKTALPFDVTISFSESESNGYLPPISGGAEVELVLDEEVKRDTIESASGQVVFRNVPSRYEGKPVVLKVTPGLYDSNAGCADYHQLDTLLKLSGNHRFVIHRNEAYYGKVRFRLWSPEGEVGGCRVRIGQYECVSDQDGYVSLDIPLTDQRPAYPIDADVLLEDSVFEMPSGSRRFVIAKSI